MGISHANLRRWICFHVVSSVLSETTSTDMRRKGQSNVLLQVVCFLIKTFLFAYMLQFLRIVIYIFIHARSNHPHRKANVIALLVLYSVLHLNKGPEEAFEPFRSMSIIPFRDAAVGVCTFGVTVLDCARALHKVNRLDV